MYQRDETQISKLLFEENLKVEQVIYLSIETIKLHQDTMESLFMGNQFFRGFHELPLP